MPSSPREAHTSRDTPTAENDPEMNPGPRNPNSSSAEMAEGVGATVSLAILVGLALGEALGDVLGAVLGNVLGEAVGLKQKITSKPGKIST